jgi:hypothetical protein
MVSGKNCLWCVTCKDEHDDGGCQIDEFTIPHRSLLLCSIWASLVKEETALLVYYDSSIPGQQKPPFILIVS